MLAIAEGGGRGEIVVVTASGRLVAEDYRRFTPAFERLARSRGPLRVLLELPGFRGWEAGALWEQLKFDVTHQWAFRRIAVVGERRWQGWGDVAVQAALPRGDAVFRPDQDGRGQGVARAVTPAPRFPPGRQST